MRSRVLRAVWMLNIEIWCPQYIFCWNKGTTFKNNIQFVRKFNYNVKGVSDAEKISVSTYSICFENFLTWTENSTYRFNRVCSIFFCGNAPLKISVAFSAIKNRYNMFKITQSWGKNTSIQIIILITTLQAIEINISEGRL